MKRSGCPAFILQRSSFIPAERAYGRRSRGVLFGQETKFPHVMRTKLLLLDRTTKSPPHGATSRHGKENDTFIWSCGVTAKGPTAKR